MDVLKYYCLYLSSFCSVVVVYKKRKTSSEPQACAKYTDMGYDVKTQSLKTPSPSHSQPTSPSHQHYVKPPKIAMKPARDIELQENEAYESI